MKRILIFSLAYHPHVGGAEVALKEITDRIEDIEFHLITLRFRVSPREERIGNVFVHRVGNGSSYMQKILFIPRAARRAVQLHRKHPYNAFWAMMSYMLFPIVLLRFFGVRMPYLLTLQEGDPFEHVFHRLRILPFRPLLATGFKNASIVQTISMYLAVWAKQAGFPGVPEVVSNGVDVAQFARIPEEKEVSAVRAEIGKKEGEVWLIHTGRLVHKNALDTSIRALALLPQYIHFFMVGDGSDKKALTMLASEIGVSARVHFHSFVPIERLPGYLKACNIFIRPSRSEGMGNSFVEAMAAGLPVVGTQEGGITDFLFDAKRNPDKDATGWAVDVDSPKQIAAVVQDILAHPAQTERVILAAQKLVSEKYDWNFIASRMQTLFDRLLKKQ